MGLEAKVEGLFFSFSFSPSALCSGEEFVGAEGVEGCFTSVFSPLWEGAGPEPEAEPEVDGDLVSEEVEGAGEEVEVEGSEGEAGEIAEEPEEGAEGVEEVEDEEELSFSSA